MTVGDFVQRLVPSLPRVSWAQLPPRARRLVIAAVTGVLSRPSPSSFVSVMPRGGSQTQSAAHSYGPSGTRYGWRGEAELMESAPADASASSEEPAQASTPSGPAPTPSSRAGATPPEEPADAAPAGDTAAAAPDASDAGEPPQADEPVPATPATFGTADGNTLTLTPDLLRQLLDRFRRRYPDWRRRRYPYWWYRRDQRPMSPASRRWWGRPVWRRPGFVRPWSARQAIVGRFGRLARGARRIGALRSVRSGRRFPVFGGRVGGQRYRIVTRPRGRVRHEIMLVRRGALEQELTR
jgi:hypothetical protein